MNTKAREELEAEWNARADYLTELAAEHFDPAAGHEDEALAMDAPAVEFGDIPY